MGTGDVEKTTVAVAGSGAAPVTHFRVPAREMLLDEPLCCPLYGALTFDGLAIDLEERVHPGGAHCGGARVPRSRAGRRHAARSHSRGGTRRRRRGRP